MGGCVGGWVWVGVGGCGWVWVRGCGWVWVPGCGWGSSVVKVDHPSVLWLVIRGSGSNHRVPTPGELLCREVAGGNPSTASRHHSPLHGPPYPVGRGPRTSDSAAPRGVRAASVLSLGRSCPTSRTSGGDGIGHRSLGIATAVRGSSLVGPVGKTRWGK